MRRVASAAAVLVLGLAAPSSAAERDVSIPGKFFEPGRLQVLVGETVTWHNGDAVTHTVTADDGSFDSGDLAPDGAFSVTFDRVGTTTYHCAIHHFMTGEVDVFALALSGPLHPIRIGAEFTLRGLAAPGTESALVERLMPDGGFVAQTTAPVSAEGRFRVSLPAVTSGDYRARAGELSSPLARVDVHPEITLRVRQVGRRAVLDGVASPPQPGMPAVLEAYSRERFNWVRFGRVQFNTRSRMRFAFAPTRKVALRLVLLHATAGLVGGPSNVLSVTPR
ncbi:MAG TPA: cupredoxin family copper-binding protein [Gaiellaceae bacterium]|nr:cupredoxin family copper-binding protein [Gaiellaceae bacterium]